MLSSLTPWSRSVPSHPFPSRPVPSRPVPSRGVAFHFTTAPSHTQTYVETKHSLLMLEKLMLKEGVLKEQSLKYLSRNAGGDLVAQMNKWPGCVELCTAVARLLPHIVQNDAQAVAALKEAGALLALVESLLVVKADTPAVIHNSAKKQRARDAYCGALQSLLPQSSPSDVANAVDQLMSVHSSEHERLVHELLDMGGAAHIESECLYPSVPVDAPEPSPFVFRTESSEIPTSAPIGFVATEAPALPVVFRADPATPSGEFHFRTAVPALTPSVSPFVFEPATPTPSGGVTFGAPVAATTASPFVFGVVPSTPSGGFAFSTVAPALTPLPAKDGGNNGTASAEIPSRTSPVSVKDLVLEGSVSAAGGSFDRLPSLVRSACLFAATLTFLKCALAY